jgi:hypothetical protein
VPPGRRPFGAIAAWSVRHARAVLVVAIVIAVAAAIAATQVDTDAGLSTLVDKGDPTYEATQRVRAEFGEEPVVVLVKESLPKLLLGKDLLRLTRLEGCLSGKVPKNVEPLPGACAEIARLKPVSFLAGPATFLNESVVQIDEQLERMSRRIPASRNSCSRSRPSTGSPRRRASRTKNSSPPSSSTWRRRGARRRRGSPTSSRTRIRPRS